MVLVTYEIMRKIYPSASGTQFEPYATPYVTCVCSSKRMPFDCRVVFCIAVELQLFQYHATRKQVPHAARGRMTSSSPPCRWLPLPYQKHGYCLVPFAFLSFRMSLLSPRTRASSHGICAFQVLLICFTLLTILLIFWHRCMCHSLWNFVQCYSTWQKEFRFRIKNVFSFLLPLWSIIAVT